jgi:hypothetical protein
MLLTSMAIVKEREIGTLEQLVVTPITPAELIVGKTLPYIASASSTCCSCSRSRPSGSACRSPARWRSFALAIVFIFTSSASGCSFPRSR